MRKKVTAIKKSKLEELLPRLEKLEQDMHEKTAKALKTGSVEDRMAMNEAQQAFQSVHSEAMLTAWADAQREKK